LHPLGAPGASDTEARRRWLDALGDNDETVESAGLDTTEATRNLSGAYVAAVKH
jgi:hypothetical protein